MYYRIKAGELVGWEFVDNYPKIGECLVLYFSTQPFVRPIRPHSYHRYVDSLAGRKNMLYEKQVLKENTDEVEKQDAP